MRTGGLLLSAALALLGSALHAGELEVVEKLSARGGMSVSTAPAAPPLLHVPGAGGQGYVGIGTTEPSVLFQVGAGTLSVSSSGWVGVGTTEPRARLEVLDGDVRISTVGGPRGIVYPDSTWQTTARMDASFPIRFTRATLNSNDTDANKDALCRAEWGPNYDAASFHEVVLYWKDANTYNSTEPWYNTAGYNGTWGYYRIQWTGCRSSSYALCSYHYQVAGNSNQRIACIKRNAALRFTRTAIAAGAGDAAKDNQCLAEFGYNYRTAQKHDMMGIWNRGPYWNAWTPYFNLVGLDSGSSFYIVSNDGATYDTGVYVHTAGAGTYPVACLSR